MDYIKMGNSAILEKTFARQNLSIKDWMFRINKYLMQCFTGVSPSVLIKNTELFDNITVILINSLQKLVNEIDDKESIESFSNLKYNYGRFRAQANASVIRIFQSNTKQFDLRIAMTHIFVFCWYYVYFYTENNVFPATADIDEEKMKEWYDQISAKNEFNLRLYVDADKAVLKKYEKYEEASIDNVCGLPFPGKGGVCCRKRHHTGPHIIKVPYFGVVGVWE